MGWPRHEGYDQAQSSKMQFASVYGVMHVCETGMDGMHAPHSWHRFRLRACLPVTALMISIPLGPAKGPWVFRSKDFACKLLYTCDKNTLQYPVDEITQWKKTDRRVSLSI